MNNKKTRLVLSITSFLLVVVIFIGCTFESKKAIFSTMKQSFSGTTSSNFDIQLFWSEDPDNNGWTATDESGSNMAFSSSVLWEPGHTEIRYFKIANAGDIDFTYELDFDSPGDEYDSSTDDIGNVIDVYSKMDTSSDYIYEGTLNEVVLNPQILTGDIAAGNSVSCLIKFVMKESAGNDYQGHKVGFKVKASAYAEEPETEFDGTFGCTFPNYESLLYRVGNSNSIEASSLFYINEEESTTASSLMIRAYASSKFDNSLVSFASSWISGDASVTITPNETDWSQGLFSFTGTGVINIKLFYDSVEKVSLNLEVMDGKNVISAASASSSNIILLNDVSSASNLSVSKGYTLYGNGFSITDKRTTTSGTAGFMNILNGTLDNVQIIGQEYPEVITSGVSNDYYSPCIYISDGYTATINNSLVSGCKTAVHAEGNLIAENTTFAGGTYTNLTIMRNAELTNCITTYSMNSGLKTLSVIVGSVSAHITLNGTFNQYNWISKSDISDSTYSSILSSVYSNKDYAYTTGGKTYINTGILCFIEGSSFTEELAETVITDNTENSYGYETKTFSSTTATCYLPKSSMASSDNLSLSTYSMIGQYPTMPTADFDYDTLNYIAKTEDSNKYCYYDSSSDTVLISFESTESSFDWNPMILTLSKYSYDINYTVSMNGTDYTGKNISFSSAGNYEVVYTYIDNYYYSGKNADKGSLSYTKTIKINVTIADPAVIVYHPTFTYTSCSTKSVIINNYTYVMPDINETSSSYGSKAVDGQTIYYPIIEVEGKSSSGGDYSKYGIYYFAPAFSEINITDYNQSTGDSQYTYNTSSTTWPHGNSATKGPNTDIYYYDTSGANPYEPSSGNSSQGFKSISGLGLCFSTSNIERNGAAGNKVVKFKYVGNDGITYYYYICYSYVATTYDDGGGTCFASGTTVTTADGSQKPIESLNLKDKVMSWNFYKGESEEKEICLLVDHGKNTYEVLNLEFSDGTVLKIITEHGVYDYDTNDFVYINSRNYKDYIGDRFVKYKSNGKYKKVKLTNAYVTTEETHAYSIATADNLNAFTNGMLSLTPPGDYYNPIKKGNKLRFDTEELNKDIEKYGLYKYEDFKDYLTPYQFYAFNVDYMKVPVSKGEITFDYILQLIEGYSKYFA